MNYTLTTYTDLPAVVCIMHADFDAQADLARVIPEVIEAFDGVGSPVYYIVDVGESRWPFPQIVQGLAQVTAAGAMLRHPNLAEVLVIADSQLVEMGVKALAETQYGSIRTRLVSSVQDGLNTVRSQFEATA
ncbi:MAG: hypothetical protein ACFB51_08700 [Anaerolineae bacterium]